MFTVVNYRKPKHPSWVNLEKRKASFTHWPHQKPGPKELAACGFYHTGPKDGLTCFFCSVFIDNWKPKDHPYDKHVKWNADCYFLAVNARDLKRKWKEPEISKPVVHFMQTQEKREASFTHWSGTIPAQQLAKCGFYYCPLDRVVICFFCNITLPEQLLSHPSKIQHEPHCCFRTDETLKDLDMDSDLKLCKYLDETLQLSKDLTMKLDSDLKLCIVCLTRDREITFQPCGHFIACQICYRRLSKFCYVCKQSIMYTVRTYL